MSTRACAPLPSGAPSPVAPLPASVSVLGKNTTWPAEDEVSLSASTLSPHRSACASGASSPPLPGETLPATQWVTQSPAQLVRGVQEACSDLLFVLDEGDESSPEFSSSSFSQEQQETLSSSSSSSPSSLSSSTLAWQPRVVTLVGSYSNGDVIRGTMEQEKEALVSVASSSGQVACLVPALMEAVTRGRALVVHVAAYQLNDTLGLEAAPWQGLEALKACGCAILFSSSAQEAHDMALVAHLLALRARQPVVHWYEGLRARQVYEPTQALARSVASSWMQELRAQRAGPRLTLSQAATWAWDLVAHSWQRVYQSVERGGASPATQVLLTGPGSALGERVPASWGVVLVRLYRPWDAAALRQSMPEGAHTVWVEPSFLQRDVAWALHQWPPTQRPLVRLWSGLDSLPSSEQAAWEESPCPPIVEILQGPTRDTCCSSSSSSSLSSEASEAQRVAQFLEAHPALASGALLIHRNGYRHHITERWLVGLQPVSPSRLLGVQQVAAVVCPAHALQDPISVQSLPSQGAHLLVFPSLSSSSPTEEEGESQTAPSWSKVSHEADTWPCVPVARAVRHVLEEKQVALSFASTCSQALAWLMAPEATRPTPHVSGDGLTTWLARVDAAQDETEPEEPSETMVQATEALAQLGSLRTSTLFRGKSATRVGAAPESSPAEAMTWRFLFPEAYQVEKRLKPHARDSHGLHQVRVTQWLRLTPESYDRNVFHIEMDISATSLRYEIGDALGVYGHNSPAEVEAFVRAYAPQASPAELLALPLPHHSGALQLRSLEQILTQDVDLFGRPTKRLYARLAPYATDPIQEALLRELGDGTADENFRQRSEESMTIAEVLLEFTSARPPWAELVEIVGAIKPRHYSIASSMNMHPDSVHLLVVDHTWVTPQGRLRRGQCTRYLQGLREGEMVTVSVKPSIMKLPASHSTPIVMAGLGTGMAPFRAFLQERLYQQQVNQVDIGEMVLYFGSRSSREEYLYGEELETYLTMGTLTHMGLAFSRDQAHKIYIQHKIREDGALLWRLLHVQRGTFYLCGPTWPAADVQDAITANLEQEGAWSSQRAIDEVMAMKAAERYILEVY